MSTILVYSGTVGYRHDSIESGVEAVRSIAKEAGLDFIHTEDADVFSHEVLENVGVTVWMQTSGTGLLNADQREAYERYTTQGGGFAAIHAASDGERDWPLFDTLVGARFLSHPSKLQTVPVHFELSSDPSALGLQTPWEVYDEWYSFDRSPRNSSQIIAVIRESEYDAEKSSMGDDHPIAWRGSVGLAKTWYTALGHEASAFESRDFRSHLRGGILSVRREIEGYK